MMGGLTHGSELNTFEIASEFARRVNAQCNYLAAPIYAGSPKSRDTILAQDVFRETFQRLATNDVALMSVGDLSRRSLLVRYGLPRTSPSNRCARRAPSATSWARSSTQRGQPIEPSA